MNEELIKEIEKSICVHFDIDGNTIAEELDTGYWYQPFVLAEFNVSLPTMVRHVGHVMATENTKRNPDWTPKRTHHWLTKEERNAPSQYERKSQ